MENVREWIVSLLDPRGNIKKQIVFVGTEDQAKQVCHKLSHMGGGEQK